MFKKISYVITFLCAIYVVQSLPAYPPCYTCNCVGNQCAVTHEKYAVAQVKKGNPFVTPVVIYKQVPITDNCCNRVWILVDRPGGNGFVTNIPAVG
ncbi:hypothetical protein H5410_064871 [Solanum commersonii]|uniref:Uncharacterized protein n=1 Tax=Solanum commersonii TaxID=4109 RepID=A0A9J5VY47_SOLCO|nr:hypothetical protein H5410_064867 [Solanum commersonii]KAG5568116.1 hypothetical protein H5410_064871 [Solanum commersonii]